MMSASLPQVLLPTHPNRDDNKNTNPIAKILASFSRKSKSKKSSSLASQIVQQQYHLNRSAPLQANLHLKVAQNQAVANMQQPIPLAPQLNTAKHLTNTAIAPQINQIQPQINHLQQLTRRLNQLFFVGGKVSDVLAILASNDREQAISILWKHCGSRQSFESLLNQITQQNSLEVIRAFLKDLEYKRVLDNRQIVELQYILTQRKQVLGTQMQQQFASRGKQKASSSASINQVEQEVKIQQHRLHQIQNNIFGLQQQIQRVKQSLNTRVAA